MSTCSASEGGRTYHLAAAQVETLQGAKPVAGPPKTGVGNLAGQNEGAGGTRAGGGIVMSMQKAEQRDAAAGTAQKQRLCRKPVTQLWRRSHQGTLGQRQVRQHATTVYDGAHSSASSGSATAKR